MEPAVRMFIALGTVLLLCGVGRLFIRRQRPYLAFCILVQALFIISLPILLRLPRCGPPPP
ncbi:MAG: hypothetical protein AB1446_08025 [Bacillota bacterium]